MRTTILVLGIIASIIGFVLAFGVSGIFQLGFIAAGAAGDNEAASTFQGSVLLAFAAPIAALVGALLYRGSGWGSCIWLGIAALIMLFVYPLGLPMPLIAVACAGIGSVFGLFVALSR